MVILSLNDLPSPKWLHWDHGPSLSQIRTEVTPEQSLKMWCPASRIQTEATAQLFEPFLHGSAVQG